MGDRAMCVKTNKKNVELRGKREGRNHFTEHRSLGFSVQLDSKTIFNLLINREVKLPAFPVAASWKVSHLLWLREQRPRHERDLAEPPGGGGGPRREHSGSRQALETLIRIPRPCS